MAALMVMGACNDLIAIITMMLIVPEGHMSLPARRTPPEMQGCARISYVPPGTTPPMYI